MPLTLFRLRLFLRHLIRARHRRGRGIHSPFVYEFVSRVLYNEEGIPENRLFRETGKELLRSKEEIVVQEIGAGSAHFSSGNRRIRDMVRYSSVQPEFGELLYRIARFYRPAVMVELGTSVGLSALCLATGNPEGKVITLEGVPALCKFAAGLFKDKDLQNIEVLQGDFEELLPGLTKIHPCPDLVHIDGNHTFEATLNYYDHFISRMQKGILIFDDINWSPGMQRAWQMICLDKRSAVNIDLHHLGIVFPDRSLTPGQYVVRM